jgi:hypothetical protein
MSEWKNGLKNFFGYWFSGFANGLERVDEETQKIILSECGKACAHSYTVQVFQEARENSTGIDSFFENLAARLPGAHYEKTGTNLIRATYHECGCDLVRLGLMRSHTLCECSARNLQENLECSLGKVASVEIQSSILRGGTNCVLIVSMADDLKL